MKKAIYLTLALIILLSSLCSCNGKKPDESDKNIDNNDNNYNQNIEDDNNNTNGNNNGDQKNDPSKLTYEHKPIAVAKDEHGDYYAYVKEWNAYYLMPSEGAYSHKIVRPYYFPVVHDNVAWLLAFNRSDGELSTYKFFRESETVETYNHICERKESYDELFGYFYDFYDEDHGYIFFWDEYEALTTSWKSTAYLRTDDGGKTWYSPVCEASAHSCCSKDIPIFAKFVSDNVAVISYENSECHYGFCGKVGITTDGGISWKEISRSFPFPESLLTKEWFKSEVIGFEYINNEYLIDAKVYGYNDNGRIIYIQFSSTDLESWALVKQTNISEIVEAYKEYIRSGEIYAKDMISCARFALLDYNRDGILDVAMQSGDGQWDRYAWYVLCYENGKCKMERVPGYQINTKNGEVGWNERAGTIYGGKIYDPSQKYGYRKIWRIENDGTENAKYYINDLPVSGDEIMYYFEEYNCDEQYEIYKFTEENIEKYINVETFLDKSYFCSCSDPKSDYDGYCNIINLYKDLILYKNDGNDVSAFDLSGYTDISSEISSALKQIVFNNVHQLMGYAFKDINNDGAAELVLLDRDYNIFAIFTSVDQKAVLVDTFGVGNHTGAIDEKGTIYKSGYTKGETWFEKIMTLNESGELKEELKYGCIDYGGYYEDPQEAEYYKYVSGVKYSITKAELDGLSSQYSSVFSDTARITKDSGISFNAIMEIDPK